MDYEKKYKEALERARKWYNDSHITIGLKGNLNRRKNRQRNNLKYLAMKIADFERAIKKLDVDVHIDEIRM